MATETKTAGTDPEVLADIDALMRHLLDKTPVDPELSRRVEERADLAIDALRKSGATIDVDKLLHEVRDDV